MILKDFPIISFDGGVVRNKSSYAMKKNELLSAYNVEIDELGRIIKRKGFQHHGTYYVGDSSFIDLNPVAASAENSFSYVLNAASAAMSFRHFVNDAISTGRVWEIRGDRLTAAITTASTTIVLSDGTYFPSSANGMVEIEGNIINYTGKTSNTLTGVTGITSSHAIGAPVHISRQITAPTPTTWDFTAGGYYAMASDGTSNDELFISSRTFLTWIGDGGVNATGSTTVTVLFITNYRDRLYGCGSGAGSLATSGVNRVFYSALGNGTSWTTASYFDVSDAKGDITTGQIVFADKLLIFKTNSFFVYNQVTLKQKSTIVGAYNNKVIQEVNGLIYTTSPSGVWVTNGVSSKKISKPVEEYLKHFKPIRDANNRVVTNIFGFKYRDFYGIYIKDITKPESLSDVCLVYDTVKKNWTIHHSGYSDFVHINSFPRFLFGNRLQDQEGIFAGGTTTDGTSMRYWKLYSNEHYTGAGASAGGDILTDLFFNTGTQISASFETPLYDLATPQYIKKFKYIRGLSEVVGWNAEYRIEDKVGVSGYKPIGQFQRPNQRLVIPNTPSGYRIGFRFSNNDRNSTGVFNGFIIEDTEAIPSKQ